MSTESNLTALVNILQLAYSGELAAAYAYRGHWKSLKNTAEISKIQQIENEEWLHREKVGCMLKYLNSQPKKSREIKSWVIGHTIGILCHLVGWFIPMYFAGKLESGNTKEYENAAIYARELNLLEFEKELYTMSVVEKEHENFFLNTIVGHRLLPLMIIIFKWGKTDISLSNDLKSYISSTKTTLQPTRNSK
ncbi:MAG: ferritin-like domain-containing protein [Acidobacteriota bacterium]